MARVQKIRIPSKKEAGAYTLEQENKFNMFRAIGAKENAASTYAAAMQVYSDLDNMKWRGDEFLPPGTPASIICDAFRRYTDQPLDISFHTFMCYLSVYLLEKGVIVECGGQKAITPEIWTIVLAPSGSGKTYASDRIVHGAPVLPNIGGIRSAAALFENMKNNEEKGAGNFYYADEVAQMWRSMEQDGNPMQDVKEMLLLSYGGAKLIRKTLKHGDQEVKKSKMSFLGLNVAETFIPVIKAESMLDGTGQRFGWCYSEKDPNPERHFREFPRFDDEKIDAECERAWAMVKAIELHEKYVYTPEAIKAYDDAFKELSYGAEDDGAISVSFYRRIMQRTHKLALLYHIILGDKSAEINAVDVAWAIRLVKAHIADTARLIILKSPDAHKSLEQVKALEARLQSRGDVLSPRKIQQFIASAKDKEMAHALFDAYQKLKNK